MRLHGRAALLRHVFDEIPFSSFPLSLRCNKFLYSVRQFLSNWETWRIRWEYTRQRRKQAEFKGSGGEGEARWIVGLEKRWYRPLTGRKDGGYMARYGGGNCQISSNRVGPSHTANCGILIYYTKNINELMKCKEAINFVLVCPAQTKAMPKARKMTSQASTFVCSSGYWIVITFCERDSVRTMQL